MNKDRTVYRTTTGIIAAVMLLGALNFAFNPDQREAFSRLGLPRWFRVELTVAKILGALALVVPAVPRKVKEFAYAGFAITLVSADVAHLSSGDPAWFVAPHATLLAILAVSYTRLCRLDRGSPVARSSVLDAREGGREMCRP